MEWLIEHLPALLAIFAAVVSLASMIAALTPTPKDDEFLKKVRKLIDVLALNVGNARK